MSNFTFSLHNDDCLNVMKGMANESVDIICIDPPYLYLKGQKLERPFDEQLFFSECWRILNKVGFIVMFGRGTSFYRWNYLLSEIGFEFKEEIIWNKSQCSSPLMALSRVHETVSIHCKGKGKINKVKVPYLEMKGHDMPSIIQDIKRLKSVFNNTKSLDSVLGYLEDNKIDYNENALCKHKLMGKHNGCDRTIAALNAINHGMTEKSIIKGDFVKNEKFTKHSTTVNIDSSGDRDRCVKALHSIDNGMNEKSIIKQVRDHYSSIHPTQKPVRLLERILALVLPPGKENVVIADFFGGSFSTGEACHEISKSHCIDVHFEGCEIDNEYFEGGQKRLIDKG